jgi:hypothetical protein
MDPGLLSGFAHMDSPLLNGVAKYVYPSSLQYAAVCTRTDVYTTLSIFGYAHANPTDAHLQALKKVARYLKDTIELRLAFGKGG